MNDIKEKFIYLLGPNRDFFGLVYIFTNELLNEIKFLDTGEKVKIRFTNHLSLDSDKFYSIFKDINQQLTEVVDTYTKFLILKKYFEFGDNSLKDYYLTYSSIEGDDEVPIFSLIKISDVISNKEDNVISFIYNDKNYSTDYQYFYDGLDVVTEALIDQYIETYTSNINYYKKKYDSIVNSLIKHHPESSILKDIYNDY